MRIWPLLFLIFSTSLFAAEPTGQFATKNPYTILGVKPDTLYDEVKKIYRRMAMQHHPERYEGSDAAGRAASAENFKQISLAYAALESGNFDAFIFAGYTGCQFKSPRTAEEAKRINKAIKEGQNRDFAGVSGSYGDFDNFFKAWADKFGGKFRQAYEEKKQKEAEEKRQTSGPLQKRHRSFFDLEIVAAYGNDRGLIIELHVSKDLRFYWVPKGSKNVYPLFFSSGYAGSNYGETFRFRNLEAHLFDSGSPWGVAPFHLREGQLLSVGDTVFKRQYEHQTKMLDDFLVMNEFYLYPAASPYDHDGLWDYSVYRDEQWGYSILAREFSLDPKILRRLKVRFFEGSHPGQMQERTVVRLSNGGLQLAETGRILYVPQSHKPRPIFDTHLDVFIGNMNMGDDPLRVSDSNGQNRTEIKALSSEEKVRFSVPRFLGQFIDAPVPVPSPVHRVLFKQDQFRQLLITSDWTVVPTSDGRSETEQRRERAVQKFYIESEAAGLNEVLRKFLLRPSFEVHHQFALSLLRSFKENDDQFVKSGSGGERRGQSWRKVGPRVQRNGGILGAC
ncbi:MAG: DnaJ domain-containing protein [Bdellovibrionales bacterium]